MFYLFYSIPSWNRIWIANSLKRLFSIHFINNILFSHSRIQNTLLQVGPAVFYGGLSTLLAVVLLAASDYYPFVVFFKVFLLVVVFGLFHGLVFLPVILALVGPSHLADEQQQPPDHINKIELEKLQSTSNDLWKYCNGVVVSDAGVVKHVRDKEHEEVQFTVQNIQLIKKILLIYTKRNCPDIICCLTTRDPPPVVRN